MGDNSTAVFKWLYHIDLAGTPDVSAISGAASLAGKAVVKTLFLDVVAALNAHGIKSEDIPAKLEGMAFDQDIVINGMTKHTLYVANDNVLRSDGRRHQPPDRAGQPEQVLRIYRRCVRGTGLRPTAHQSVS